MKKFKILSFILILSLAAGLFSFPALAVSEPMTTSAQVVAAELNTGEVYYAKDADVRVAPGKCARIMTLLLAAEAVEDGRLTLYDPITASEWLMTDVSGGDALGLTAGEDISLEGLMYCAAVGSSDAACNIIGEAVSGTVSDFVVAMNARARQLGCTNTHFTNTHGAASDLQYTTAQDLCLIACEALSHDLFKAVCAETTYRLPATNLTGMRELVSGNLMINSNANYPEYYLDYAEGVCAGTGCLVTSALRDDIRLLVVILGGQEGLTPVYDDALEVFDWFFSNYGYVDILSSSAILAELHVALASDTETISIRPEHSVSALLPNDKDLSAFQLDVVIYSEQTGTELVAPISAGEILGQITVTDGDTVYGTVNLVASNSVSLSKVEYMKSQIRQTWQLKSVHTTFWVLAALMAVYVIFVIRYRIKRHLYVREARRITRAQQPVQVRPPQPEAEAPAKPQRARLSLKALFSPIADDEDEALPLPNREIGAELSAVEVFPQDAASANPEPIPEPATVAEPITAGRIETDEDRDFFEEFFGGHNG